MDDLEESIILDKELLELRPRGHPDRGQSLINLGTELSARYHQMG